MSGISAEWLTGADMGRREHHQAMRPAGRLAVTLHTAARAWVGTVETTEASARTFALPLGTIKAHKDTDLLPVGWVDRLRAGHLVLQYREVLELPRKVLHLLVVQSREESEGTI